MGTLYDELGAAPGDSASELRRAYRRQARLRHPDLRPGQEAAAEAEMRRLNRAWSVLGDPASRRRYDQELAAAAGSPKAAATGPAAAGAVRSRSAAGSRSASSLPPPRRLRFPAWALVLAVLGFIFVFTAYAGRTAGGPVQPQAGRCLTALPGLEHYVGCDQPNVGRLVTEVGVGSACPPGSFRHLLVSRNRVACLTR